MSYSERLHVPPWWVVLALAFVASIAVAVIAYLELWLAITATALAFIVVAVGLIVYSRTLLRVDDEAFTAGRYRLELAYVGEVTALEGDAAREALGPGADHRAFLFTRPFITALVRIDIDDEADPHPCWMVSTRHPSQLAEALTKAAAR